MFLTSAGLFGILDCEFVTISSLQCLFSCSKLVIVMVGKQLSMHVKHLVPISCSWITL